MKYRFTLPAMLDDPLSAATDPRRSYDVTFEAETPAEVDCGDGGEAAQGFVDRALAVARYVVKALEAKPEVR